MSRRLVAVACLVVLTLLSGCGPKPGRQAAAPPKPAPSVGVDTPIANPSKADLEQVRRRLATEPAGIPGNNGPLYATSALPDIAAARKAFAGALVPTDTAGRRLVGIVYSKSTIAGLRPSERLDLVYEGGLIVEAARPSARRWPSGPFDPTRETTSIAGNTGRMITTPGGAPGRPPTTTLNWQVDNVGYGVVGYGLTKEEVVRIARSMR